MMVACRQAIIGASLLGWVCVDALESVNSSDLQDKVPHGKDTMELKEGQFHTHQAIRTAVGITGNIVPLLYDTVKQIGQRYSLQFNIITVTACRGILVL